MNEKKMLKKKISRSVSEIDFFDGVGAGENQKKDNNKIPKPLNQLEVIKEEKIHEEYNPIIYPPQGSAPVDDAQKIREIWESRNFNGLNSWCLRTKTDLSIKVNEIKTSKGKDIIFVTHTKLMSKNGLFKEVLVSEGKGKSKKDSKFQALRELMNKMIEKGIIDYNTVLKDKQPLVGQSRIKNICKIIQNPKKESIPECMNSLIVLFEMKESVEWVTISTLWYYLLCTNDISNVLLYIDIVFQKNSDKINQTVREEMISSIIFCLPHIPAWKDVKAIVDALFEKVNFEDDGIIYEEYYKNFKKIYTLELAGTVHNMIYGAVGTTGPTVVMGNETISGDRFGQKIAVFTPEVNDNLILKTANEKEKYITEEELVLIDDGSPQKYLGFVISITYSTITKKKEVKIRRCFKVDEEPNLVNIESLQVKMIKLLNISSFNKIFITLRGFCQSTNTCSPELQSIIVSSFAPENQVLSEETKKTLIEKATKIVRPLPNNYKVKNLMLNQSQELAIISSLSNRLTIIQGPPGTGKTSTCVEIILEFLRLNPTFGQSSKILVTAESNSAVDILFRELSIAQVSVYRYSFKDVSMSSYSSIKHLIMNCKVICSTCTGTTNEYLKGIRFPFVIMDEATQANELSAIAPLLHSCNQLILVGDHKQLPPTVLCQTASKMGLGVSLCERLIKRGLPVIILNTQYRMHSSLYSFPSSEFYNNSIQTGVNDLLRPYITGINWPNDQIRYGMIDVKGKEELDPVTYSYYNCLEVSVIMNILINVINNNHSPQISIGVITPYSAQKKAIRKEVEKIFEGLLDKMIVVDTVDGFQGMEKDLIIVSFVRSNEAGAIGFVNDARRINVTLTRAKRGLVVVGNKDSMRNNPIWLKWIQIVEIYGLVIQT